MSTQSIPVYDRSLKAAADLSAKQFFAVKITATDTMNLCAAVTDIGYGILQDKPKSGETGSARRLGTSKAVVDGSTAIAAGDKLGPNAAGKLVKVTTVDRPVMATALEAATTDGAIIEVDLTPNAVYRTPA